MKFFREYFWGVFLIFSGIVILLKLRTNLNISTLRVIGGFFFVYLGISIMIGGFGYKTDHDLIFSEDEIRPIELRKEYNIIFSNGVIDLSDITLDTSKKVELNCVFGSGKVYINRETPVVIESNAVFAGLSTPDGYTVHFGDYKFSSSIEPGKNYLYIEANSVFGNLDIEYR